MNWHRIGTGTIESLLAVLNGLMLRSYSCLTLDDRATPWLHQRPISGAAKPSMSGSRPLNQAMMHNGN
jgi:hypothetical protein